MTVGSAAACGGETADAASDNSHTLAVRRHYRRRSADAVARASMTTPKARVAINSEHRPSNYALCATEGTIVASELEIEFTSKSPLSVSLCRANECAESKLLAKCSEQSKDCAERERAERPRRNLAEQKRKLEESKERAGDVFTKSPSVRQRG